MYKKILAPLDMSDFSACSLEHIKAIATGCNVPEVILLTVIEPIHQEVNYAISDQTRRDMQKETNARAKSYLSKVANSLKKECIAAQTAIVSGRPDEKILDYATENQVDLIIMSTRGRSGVSRWAFGSIADSVLRHSTVPVLISSPPECRVRL